MSLGMKSMFLEDAKGDFSSAHDLIGDDIEKNRRALRLLIEGLEKSIKALWLSTYGSIIASFLDYMESKRGCRKQTLREIRMLKDPKHVGHAASLKVLKALVDMTYLAVCLDVCKLQPKELVEYMYYELGKFAERYSEKIAKDKKFVNEVKKVLEKIRDTDTSAIIQKLLNELKDRVQKQKERLEKNITLSMEKINCEHLKEIKERIDDYIKMDKIDKKGKRAIIEICMKINKEYIDMEVNNVLELLGTMKKEKSKLVSNIQESIYIIINELKEEPAIKEILELSRVRKAVDNFAKVLIALATRIVSYFYGVLALTKLHLIIYPCYWPSRYKHEGQIPSEVLDKEVLRKLSNVAHELVNYIEGFLLELHELQYQLQ
jgi:gas vesicle protein